MKKILFILIATVTLTGNAQDIKVPSSLIVMEGTYKMDGVDRPGFDIVLQGEDKEIISTWVKYVNDKFDIKMKAKGATASGIEFSNSIWSDKQFALNSAVIKDGSGLHLRVWMMFGADIFVSTSKYPSEAANIKSVIKDYSKSYYVGIFQKELDSQTKIVESQGKEVTDLNKDQSKNERSIAKANKSISKAQKKAESSKKKIEKNRSLIINSDNKIAEANKNMEHKRKAIADLSTSTDPDKQARSAKMKAKYLKSIAKSQKSIAKAESKKAKGASSIEKYERAIASSAESVDKSELYIQKKKGAADKTATELKKEEDIYKNKSSDQETIKAKIKAIQAL